MWLNCERELMMPSDTEKRLAQIRRRRKKIAKELVAHEKQRQFVRDNIYGGNELRMAEDTRKKYEEDSL